MCNNFFGVKSILLVTDIVTVNLELVPLPPVLEQGSGVEVDEYRNSHGSSLFCFLTRQCFSN